MLKFFSFFIILFFKALLVFGNDITLEQLEELKKNNSITEEDYDFLKLELQGELNEEHFFSLFINRTYITDRFPVIYRNSDTFISMKDYFKEINFKNYILENNIFTMFLGRRLEKVVIDFNNLTIEGIEKSIFFQSGFFIHNDKYYLRLQLFRDIFLSGVDIDYSKSKISMSTKHTLPNEIRRLLRETGKAIEKKEKLKEIHYTNPRKLFDLGYLLIDFEKSLIKNENLKESSWDGELGYQGAFLLGEIKTNYNIKKGSFTSANLRYDNLPNNHYLEISTLKLDDGYWEKSIAFEKDKGFYEDGKDFVIRESVPLGSRVELIYLGATIAVAFEKNGEVEFRNKEIKSDREYSIKIHSKTGQITEKIIETTSDFNQQNKGEFQYNFSAREIHSLTDNTEDKKEINIGTYFGLTDYITFGTNYYKSPEQIQDNYIYIEKGDWEFIYSHNFKNYPYTLILGGEKIFTPKIFEKEETFQGLFQIKINKHKLTYEEGYFSDFYNNKHSRSANLESNMFEFLRSSYTYEWLEEWNGENFKGDYFDLELTKNFGRFLTTFSFEKNIEDEKKYFGNIYYTGYKNYSIKWSNSLSEKGDDFESILSLYNRSNEKNFNYTVRGSYNEKEKEKFTFEISLEYNNWLDFLATFKNNKNFKISGGINRIIDLKNIKNPVDNVDVSRVEVRSYLDINGNYKKEKNEPFIGDVEIEINNIKKITQEDKGVYFYGIPDKILYNIEPITRRPGYEVINSKFSLKGKSGGDIKMYIPIQPLFSISGQLIVDSNFLEGIVIKVRDSKGIIVSTMLPDFLGYYDISNLKMGDYTLEITSFRNLKIKPLKKKIKLEYNRNIGNTFIINAEIINNIIIERK